MTQQILHESLSTAIPNSEEPNSEEPNSHDSYKNVISRHIIKSA